MSHTIVTTPKCLVCNEESELTLSAEQVAEWQSGTLIQDAFPQLSDDQRELLKSGTHPACWRTMFGDEEDDADGEG